MIMTKGLTGDEMPFNNQIDIDRKNFDKELRGLINRADDLSPAFLTIGKMFRQSRKSIFKLKGPGGYKDLHPVYKSWKRYHMGTPYPILKLSGELEDSVINIANPHNINIITRKSFAFGTNVEYAKFHNSLKKPRNKMPLRMFIFWGEEAPSTMRNRTDATRKFAERARRVLMNYLIRNNRRQVF